MGNRNRAAGSARGLFRAHEVMSRIPKAEGKEEFLGERSGQASSCTRRAA